MSQTATPDEARARARAQAATSTWDQATIPAVDAVDLPDGVDAATVMWDETIGAGGYAARAVPRGTRVRLTDLDGDACANLLVYNSRHPIERLNVADTVKVQWQAYLGEGSLLLSDMGRVLMSITADTCGGHDTLCGSSNAARNAAKYGAGGVHGTCPDARDRFAVGLAKFGLDRRDIAPSVAFFKHVRVDPDGALRFDGTTSNAGAFVELLAELPVIVVVANTPHVLDPRRVYTATPLRITAWTGLSTTRADARWSSSPEAERAFLNTEDLLRMSNAPILDVVVEPRAPWAGVVESGSTLRIIDLGGNQAVDCLLYNPHDPAERYSAPDTIVEQGNIFLVVGSRLLSNEGRTMMTVTETTCARHDTIGGACSQESNTLRYGFHTKHQHACVENFLLAHSWRGMGKRDMTSNINWFMNVPVDADGTLGIVDGISAPGLFVELRAEMDVLVVISNCPQINNPCNGFDPTAIRLLVSR